MTRARQSIEAAGFTLIEILVVLTIIAAIIGIAVPVYLGAIDTKNVTLCKSNLKSVATQLGLYRGRFKRYPSTRSGVQFLVEPFRKKMVEQTEDVVRNLYLCPGDDLALDNVGDVMVTYGDLDNLDPLAISYAGRNTKDYPLRQKNAGTEVVACDAGGSEGREMNHRHKINVAYLDMHVGDYDVVDLPDSDAKNFEVGPNAAIEALQKLNKDN
jgi:prepilin-type N-terminal cleavage/methylation domain-containing protein